MPGWLSTSWAPSVGFIVWVLNSHLHLAALCWTAHLLCAQLGQAFLSGDSGPQPHSSLGEYHTNAFSHWQFDSFPSLAFQQPGESCQGPPPMCRNTFFLIRSLEEAWPCVLRLQGKNKLGNVFLIGMCVSGSQPSSEAATQDGGAGMPLHPLFSVVNEYGYSQPRQCTDFLNVEPSTRFIISFSLLVICKHTDLQALTDIWRPCKEGRNRQRNKVNVRIKMSSYHIAFPRPENSQNLRKKDSLEEHPKPPSKALANTSHPLPGMIGIPQSDRLRLQSVVQTLAGRIDYFSGEGYR